MLILCPETITQLVFTLALFIFGPFYGVLSGLAALRARPPRWTKPARYSGLYDLYIGTSAVFTSLAAYAGWLISGLQAMRAYPHYPHGGSPVEAVALLYTLPGFITGFLAVGLTYIIGRWFRVISLVFMFIATAGLAVIEFIAFVELMRPGRFGGLMNWWP